MLSKQFYKTTAILLFIVLLAITTLAVICYVQLEKSRTADRLQVLSIDTRRHLVSQAVQKILKCNPNLPGLALSVVKNGEVWHAAGYGYADPAKNIKATEYTRFGVASITKSFTALLVMEILERNGFSKDTKIATVLGDDFRFVDDLLTNESSVADLLSHRMGLPAYNFLRFQRNYKRDNVERDMQHFPKVKPFRNSFIYSNIGYGLLARITEKVDNKSRTWEKILQSSIFHPLDMKSSYLRSNYSQMTNVSVPHRYREEDKSNIPIPMSILIHWGSIGGSGSVMTTALDMTQWMHLLLYDGVSINGKRVISSKVVANAKQAVVPREFKFGFKSHVPSYDMFFYDYAAGLANGIYRGYKLVGHSGGTFGYNALMILVPSEKLGVFLAVNGMDKAYKARKPLIMYILDLFLGYQPWLNETTLCGNRNVRNEVAKDSKRNISANTLDKIPATLGSYIGTYGTPLFGNLTISVNTKDKTLQLTYGLLTGNIYQLNQSRKFIFEATGLFSAYGGGEVLFLTKPPRVRISRFDKLFPPTFYKLT